MCWDSQQRINGWPGTQCAHTSKTYQLLEGKDVSWNTLHFCKKETTQLDQMLACSQSRVGWWEAKETLRYFLSYYYLHL